MTLTYIFIAEISPPTKLAFFRFSLAICGKTVRDIEITLMNRYWESSLRLAQSGRRDAVQQ